MPESQNNNKRMSDDESRTVLRLFQQIADLEDEEQRAALIGAADLSEPSRRRLDRMLHTLHDRSTLLDTPLPERSRYESRSDAADWIGREVHGFRIDDLLHEGSIASVYLARQSEPVERTVVIKLLRPDAPEDFQTLFRLEQRALARLSHPNIATIHSVEQRQDGLSYIILEYINGTGLSAYCAQHKLSIAARLSLFLLICHAITYSHQRGILHRDIKPSNILVREFEGRAVPTIIDFGVSSDLLNEHDMSQQLTAGTPEYMSPEHVQHPRVVDMRADVYSLGMLLFTLLVGRIPFDRDRFTAMGLARKMVSIAEYTVAPPGQYFNTLGTRQQGQLAAERGDSIASMKSALGVELDSIFTRAVHKDKEARYQSVTDLSADIERYLAHEMVLAHPSTPAYRFRKFVRRNYWATAAAVFFLALSGLFVAKLIAQNERIRTEAASAMEEKRNAEQVASMIMETIGFADPSSEARDGTATLLDMLNHGYRNLSNTNDLRDDVRARLLLSLFSAFDGVGAYEQAAGISNTLLNELDIRDPTIRCEAMLTAAAAKKNGTDRTERVAIAKRAHTYCLSSSEDTALILRAYLSLARALSADDEYVGAIETLDEASRYHATHAPGPSPIFVDILLQLARTYSLRGDYDSANIYFASTMEMMETFYGPDHAKVIEVRTAQYKLDCLTKRRGCNISAGVDLLRRGEMLYGVKSEKIIPMLRNLAILYLNIREYEQALQMVRRWMDTLSAANSGREEGHVYAQTFKAEILLERGTPTSALAETRAAQAYIAELSATPDEVSRFVASFATLVHAQALAANGAFSQALGFADSLVAYVEGDIGGQGRYFWDVLSLRAAINAALGDYGAATADIDQLRQRPEVQSNARHQHFLDCLTLHIKLLQRWSPADFLALQRSWEAFVAGRPLTNIPPYSLIRQVVEQHSIRLR